MTWTMYVLAFVLLLGTLVVIHELGHFIVARLLGVKCERFSVGFGPPILRRRIGETEWVLAWLPLGGYVKMLGEGPDETLSPEDVRRSFNGQSPLRRIAIALAGPGMNLVLSIVVIAAMLMSGIETPTSLIGSVEPGSPAERAGIQPGDRVVAIEGQEIWRWRELLVAVRQSGSDPVSLEIERDGERIPIEVAAEPTEQGFLRIGVRGDRPMAVLGVTDVVGPAGRAGLRTGDRVVAVNGRALDGLFNLMRRLADARGPLELEIARPLDGRAERVRVTLPPRADAADEPWSIERLGAVPVDFEIVAVATASPARRAGLKEGDLLLRVGDEPVDSFAAFRRYEERSEGRPLALTLLREGKELPIEVVPDLRPQREGEELVTSYAIGIEGGSPALPPELREDLVRNPLLALWYGVRRTADIFGMVVQGVWMLATREVGIDNLAGPIGIGEIAGQSLEKGWRQYLDIMCLISVNLAILNLLPIPILDGGHIVFAVAEAARGGPVGARAREIAQTVGLSLVVLLMGFAFWNDLSRYWSGIVELLTGS